MKCFVLFLLFCVVVTGLFAQKTVYFNFDIPAKPVRYCVFDKVEFIDNRPNPEYVGIYKPGNEDIVSPIWLHHSLTEEFKALMDTAIGSVPRQPQTILINFRKFFISRFNSRFEFHVECYAKWDDGYWLVYSIDSTYRSTASQFNNTVNQVVSDFIYSVVYRDLSRKKSGEPRSYNYIANIDVNEKKALPAYTLRNVQRGIYYTYDEFKYNNPRVTEFDIRSTKKGLQAVYRLPIGNQLEKKIPKDSIYAVSDGENTWLAARDQYSRLNKRGWEFYFQADLFEGNKNAEEISLASFFFGLAGTLLTALPRKATYEFRLNHLNGRYILLRRSADR